MTTWHITGSRCAVQDKAGLSASQQLGTKHQTVTICRGEQRAYFFGIIWHVNPLPKVARLKSSVGLRIIFLPQAHRDRRASLSRDNFWLRGFTARWRSE